VQRLEKDPVSKAARIGLLSVGLALAVTSNAGSAPPQQPTLTPEQVIAARQASLDMSVMTKAEMELAVKEGLDIKKQFYPAKTLARWARTLPTMFPPGTGQGATTVETHALPTIWTDRAGFEKAAAAYASAADKLEELAQAGDSAGFAAQLAVVSKTCDACHDNYKAKNL
jgi:cytochrome c556